jgi:solute carrier family 26 (sodium-independent sulfate anion transporter), member 11
MTEFCQVINVPKNDEEHHKMLSEKIPIENFIKKRKKLLSQKIVEFIKRRIFIFSWISDYNREKAIGDLISGITIGLTMVPQSLAYANLANVPPQYGLYSAFVGSLVYVVFGTVREVSIGPTSLMSIVTITYTFEKPIEYVFVLTFISGAVELLMGVFKLGFIVDFISVPVVSSFSTATALVIIVAQLKNLLGIKFSAKNFPMTIVRLFEHFTELKFGDTAVGCVAIVFLMFLKNIRDWKIFEDKPKVKRFLFYLGIARNALIVLITAYLAYFISTKYDNVPFKLTEQVDSGIPRFSLPPFEFQHENRTVEFFEMIRELGSGVALLPLVSIIANIAIAKSFSELKIV